MDDKLCISVSSTLITVQDKSQENREFWKELITKAYSDYVLRQKRQPAEITWNDPEESDESRRGGQ